jgi:predicted dehydrogenase
MHEPSFPAAMEAFVRAVAERKPATPSLEDGLSALAVVDAAELSARSGRVITIDNGPTVSAQPLVDVAGH